MNYLFKQDPGDFNSLGSIRINFPSKDGVYMHDTPLKNLFGEDMRFHSSGCVRVQNVRELVDWLLRDTPGWSRQEIDAVVKSGERKDARLAKPVPVFWVYITAWATPDGVVAIPRRHLQQRRPRPLRHHVQGLSGVLALAPGEP